MAEEQIKGNPEEWDSIWHGYKEGEAPRSAPQLFVRGEPKNLLQFWQRCYFEDLERMCPQRDGARYLELGSGRGTLSMYLTSTGATDVTMVDLSPAAFELARVNFAREGLRLPEFVVANAEQTHLPSSSYDCIYNVGLLEHFEDPGPVIRETFRLLKPGGFTFQPIVPSLQLKKSLLCMALFKPISLPKQLLRMLGGKGPATREEKMVRTEMDRAGYLRLAQEAGFVDCACIPYNPYWKVNRDGWFEDHVTLPLYAMHHAMKRKLSGRGKPLLKTSRAFEFCYLLVGRKG